MKLSLHVKQGRRKGLHSDGYAGKRALQVPLLRLFSQVWVDEAKSVFLGRRRDLSDLSVVAGKAANSRDVHLLCLGPSRSEAERLTLSREFVVPLKA